MTRSLSIQSWPKSKFTVSLISHRMKMQAPPRSKTPKPTSTLQFRRLRPGVPVNQTLPRLLICLWSRKINLTTWGRLWMKIVIINLIFINSPWITQPPWNQQLHAGLWTSMAPRRRYWILGKVPKATIRPRSKRSRRRHRPRKLPPRKLHPRRVQRLSLPRRILHRNLINPKLLNFKSPSRRQISSTRAAISRSCLPSVSKS